MSFRISIVSITYLFCVASGFVNANDLMLTGITVFDTDENGEIRSPNRWDTTGGNGRWNLYVTTPRDGIDAEFVNSGNDVDLSPNLRLDTGVVDFYVFGERGVDRPYFGMNLFFNGSASAGISVFSEMAVPTSVNPPFFVNSSTRTLGLADNIIPASDSLAYNAGDITAVIADFSWATPSVFATDRVSRFSTEPDNRDDYVGFVRINLIAVSEPTGFYVLVLGGPALGRRYRRYFAPQNLLGSC